MHTAGFGELVATSLRTDLSGRIAYADDSAVMINTKAPAGKAGRLPYVKNSFAVIGSVPRRRDDLHSVVEMIARRLNGWQLTRTRRPFRLMFSSDGQLVGIPRGTRSRLETAVSRATGGQPMPRGGGDEYWTITRRDLDEVLFCRRNPGPRRRPPLGGLAPDVADLIVNAVGPPRPSDVVLDPFAGSGALIAARLRKPVRTAICSDLGYRDESAHLLLELADRPEVWKLADDAQTLTSIPDDAVDVVVTDPPWGEYDPGAGSAESVIGAALEGISRVLRPDGKLAMLMARRLATDVTAQWRRRDFRLHRSYELLLNGHPATLLVGSSDRADRS